MIRIVIVEDHILFREGVKSVLADVADFKVVAEFSNGKDYLENIDNLKADVVLMDIEMPLMNGIETTALSKANMPSTNIIALSMFGEQKYYFEMIKAGASGFLLKEASPPELEKAIREVQNGMGFFSPALLQKAIVALPKIEHKKRIIDNLQLTNREMEVLELICKGLNNSGIAEKLFLSTKTVESHKTKLLTKTNTKNSAELILFSIKNKLIEL